MLHRHSSMNNDCKIAIITPFGAEPRLDHFAEFLLAKKLRALGHNIQFYTYRLRSNPQYRKNQLYQGIKVFRCRQRLGIAPGLFFSIIRFRPHVVIFFHPKSFLSFSAFLATKFSGAKTISEIVSILHDPFIVKDTDDPYNSIRSDVRLLTNWKQLVKSLSSGKFLLSWKNFIYHMPIARADIIVAIYKEEQYYIQKFYGRNSVLIHWALPEDSNREQSKPDENIYGKIPEKYLLFIAQIKKRKGWDTALEALAVLKNQGMKKNIVFVCPTHDVSAAENYARKLGVREQIFFLSGVNNEEKNWLYANSQGVLAPSRYEGFGLPVFEALRAGKPVLTTTIPVYQEILKHEVDSLLSRPGNAEELAKNIKTLDDDSSLAAKLVANGRRTASKYTDTIMTEKFLTQINKLADTACITR